MRIGVAGKPSAVTHHDATPLPKQRGRGIEEGTERGEERTIPRLISHYESLT